MPSDKSGSLVDVLLERANLSFAEFTTNPESIAKSTLRHLIQAWSVAPQRNATRTRLKFDLPLAVSFDAIHSILLRDDDSQHRNMFSGASYLGNSGVADANLHEITGVSSGLLDLEKYRVSPDLGNINDSQDTETSYDLLELERHREADHFVGIKNSSANAKVWSKERQAFIAKEPPIEVSPYITLATTNESTCGCCVNWQHKNVPRIKIGELVGILIPARPNNCSLAVARWISDSLEHGLQVGLQILLPNVEAINLLRQDARQIAYREPILIPALKSMDNPMSLVTMPLAINKEDKDLFIREENTEKRIRITKLVDNGGAFTQFYYEYK